MKSVVKLDMYCPVPLAAMTEPSEVQPPAQKQDEHNDQDDSADPGRSISLVVVAPVGQAAEDEEQEDNQKQQ
jgi:hypothetical protein